MQAMKQAAAEFLAGKRVAVTGVCRLRARSGPFATACKGIFASLPRSKGGNGAAAAGAVA